MPDDAIIPRWDQLPDLPWKEKIAYMTWRFLQLEQTSCPLEHEFKDGKYYRTIRIPAQTLFIGRAHKFGHEVQLLQGTVRLITEQGDQIRESPDAMRTVPGYHTVFEAITDVVGRSIHPDTGERDIEKIEDMYFESTKELEALGESVHRRLTWQA